MQHSVSCGQWWDGGPPTVSPHGISVAMWVCLKLGLPQKWANFLWFPFKITLKRVPTQKKTSQPCFRYAKKPASDLQARTRVAVLHVGGATLSSALPGSPVQTWPPGCGFATATTVS